MRNHVFSFISTLQRDPRFSKCLFKKYNRNILKTAHRYNQAYSFDTLQPESISLLATQPSHLLIHYFEEFI